LSFRPYVKGNLFNANRGEADGWKRRRVGEGEPVGRYTRNDRIQQRSMRTGNSDSIPAHGE